MNLFENLKLVIKNMLEKKARVFFTIAGIIIGIFTFTFFMFVSQGLQNAISEQFSSLGTNVLLVSKAGQGGTNGPPIGEGLTDKEVNKIKQVVREYEYIAPGIFYKAKYEYGRESKNILTVSYKDENLNDLISDLGVGVYSGRTLKTGDRGSITLGYKIAKEGFKREIKVGNSLKIGDNSFRVIGISNEQGDLFMDNSVFMNFNDIQKISGQNTYGVIRVKFQEGADLSYYYDVIERKLNPNGKEKTVEITSPEQVQEQLNQIIGLLTSIIVFISSIALIVGGINVMNTMYSSVIERTNEISVMKALGAKNSDIISIFLLESSILGFIGGFLGFFLSYGLAELLSYLITNYLGYNVPIYFNSFFLVIIIGTTTILTTIFGTYPALKAAKVNPADNLRDE